METVRKQIDQYLSKDGFNVPLFVMTEKTGGRPSTKVNPVLNRRIKDIRKERGLNQAEFAKLVNLSSSLISGIEKEQKPVTNRTKLIIEKSLNIKL